MKNGKTAVGPVDGACIYGADGWCVETRSHPSLAGGIFSLVPHLSQRGTNVIYCRY